MSTASIVARTRMEVQDQGFPFAATIPVDGISTVFDLPVESISQFAEPPTVVFNGAIISGQATLPYWINYKYGVITFFTAPSPAGAILGVQGTTYDYFDDDEVSQAVTEAFNLHVADQDPPLYIDPLPGQCGLDPNEQMLVAFLAAVQLLWMRANDTAQEIDIVTPEGVHISRAQRYDQIMRQINDLQNRYNTFSMALGVGVFRIQVLNMRRVSYATNRLVPIFKEQEIDKPYAGFNPTTGVPGAIIDVFGKWFSNPTNPAIVPTVYFGGVPSQSVTVIDDGHLQAVVPNGAVTGQIEIMTLYGVVLSTAMFVVGQPAPFILYGPERIKIPIPPGK